MMLWMLSVSMQSEELLEEFQQVILYLTLCLSLSPSALTHLFFNPFTYHFLNHSQTLSLTSPLTYSGFFATSQVAVPYSFGTTAGQAINGVYYSGIHLGGHQLAIQIVGICFAAGWSFCGTYIILQVIDKTIGLRVSESDEDIGLDSSLHGEQINKQKIHQDLDPKPFKECSTYEVGVPGSAEV
jgi:Ammonium Transporter Family